MELKATKKEIRTMMGFRDNPTVKIKVSSIGSDPEVEVLDRNGNIIYGENCPYTDVVAVNESSCDDCNRCDDCNPCDYCNRQDYCEDYCYHFANCQEDCSVPKEERDCANCTRKLRKIRVCENLGCSGELLCEECDDSSHVCEGGCSRCDDCGGRRESSTGEDPYSAPIGLDGSGNVVEFRPEPAESVSDAVMNLRTLFERAARGGAMFTIKGDNYAIGAHMHFGITVNDQFSRVRKPSWKWLFLLDYFLGRTFSPVNGGARGGYAVFATEGVDINDEGWRGQGHGLEYRSCPATVLATPRMAKIWYKIGWHITKRFFACRDFEVADMSRSATDEELHKYAKLSSRDIAYLRRFIQYWGSHSRENVVARWCKGSTTLAKEKVKMPKFNIDMSGGDLFTDEVRAFLEWNINKAETKRKGTIIRLFGLNKERGENVVFGFSCEGYTNADDCGGERVRYNTLTYGLPYHFRSQTDVSQDWMQKLVFALRQDIQNKLKEER